MDTNLDIKKVEEILKRNGAYILSSVDGEGYHVGRFKGIGLDTEGNFIIEADIDNISSTVKVR